MNTRSENHVLIKLQEARKKLEEKYQYITEGIILRSKAEWYEHGEKNSKYFLNLEKQNKNKSCIRKIKSGSTEVSSEREILKQIKDFYVNKYASQERNDLFLENFFNNITLPALDLDEASMCGKVITLTEIHETLKSMKPGKSPGNDGLPSEFYLGFFRYYW